MEIFYNLLDFVINNLGNFISSIAEFFTSDLGDSIASIVTDGNSFWTDILSTLIDVTDVLGIYDMTPLEIMLGIGLPVCLVWMLIKWLLPTS